MAAPNVSSGLTGGNARSKGRVAEHDPETVLDLVAAVAHAVVTSGAAPSPQHVPMAAFNRARVEVDRARGITDPVTNPARTPTAEAIHMRFSKLAGRSVPWAEILDGATRSGRSRVMWLAALRREDAVDELTDVVVINALRLVAARREVLTVSMREYTETRDALVAQDGRRNGEDGTLHEVLPTANQILAHCGLRWLPALQLAGMAPATAAQARSQRSSSQRHSPPPPQRTGLPVAQMVAHYAALNGTWPSKPLLHQFAAAANARMADTAGPIGPYREQAAELLRAEGVPVPTRTRGGGKAKRATFRYPLAGIPGAPPRNRRRPPSQSTAGGPGAAASAAAGAGVAGATAAGAAGTGAESGQERPRRQRGVSDDGAVNHARREYAVLSLRVWLAGLQGDTSARRTRREYVAWQTGTHWLRAGAFDDGMGGFTALKMEAAAANTSVRRTGGDPLIEALALAAGARARFRGSWSVGADGAPARETDPEPVPFSKAVRAVLAGNVAELVAERQ